jgi:hypothetical protein
MPRDRLRDAALWAVLLVPVGLLHAWVLAELGIAVTDVMFLVAMVRARDAAWLRRPWMVAALAWWGWLMICSLPVHALPVPWQLGIAEAVVVGRLLLFTAALEHWVLRDPPARLLLWWALALSCLWIGVECWQQYFTGTNMFGDRRFGDGSLTGPFVKPRAGQLYAHLLYIAMLPPVVALFGRGRSGAMWGGALAVLGVVTSVLIGQRMGLCLTGLGLVVAALFIAPLRRVAVLAAMLGGAVLVATPYISPPTHAKLVGETARNMHHFWQSPYGELYTRAAVMGLQSPIRGWGYNGFRELCPLPRFDDGLPALGIPPTSVALAACNLHPQNYYVQAFADAGWPGLGLFVALVLVWSWELGRGLWRRPEPLRVGLFIGLLSFTWPLASTDEFPTLYMLGWMFLLLGLGLAHAHIAAASPNKGEDYG